METFKELFTFLYERSFRDINLEDKSIIIVKDITGRDFKDKSKIAQYNIRIKFFKNFFRIYFDNNTPLAS